MRSKARVTITLARDLLDLIDRMVDQKDIRNRSHAIETLLRESLMPSLRTAVLLAGGKPRRGILPPLKRINDRTLIEITIGHLVDAGVRQIYILAGENQGRISDVVGHGAELGAKVTYVDEGTPRGTAGAVKLIGDRIGPETFLVLHGDILTDIDLSAFVRFHKQEDRLATVAVKPREAERRYGKVMLQGNRITEFSDHRLSEGISIVNAGMYLLQPETLGLIEGGRPATFEEDLFPHLASIGELSAFMFQGVWFDISLEDSYRLALDRWARADHGGRNGRRAKRPSP